MQHRKQLLRIGHHLAKVAALAAQLGRVRLLEIGEPDLARRQMTSDRQNRNPIAMTIEEAIDQM
jgi:hypothetical protein